MSCPGHSGAAITPQQLLQPPPAAAAYVTSSAHSTCNKNLNRTKKGALGVSFLDGMLQHQSTAVDCLLADSQWEIKPDHVTRRGHMSICISQCTFMKMKHCVCINHWSSAGPLEKFGSLGPGENGFLHALCLIKGKGPLQVVRQSWLKRLLLKSKQCFRCSTASSRHP